MTDVSNLSKENEEFKVNKLPILRDDTPNHNK